MNQISVDDGKREDDRQIDAVLQRAFMPPTADALARLLPAGPSWRRRIIGIAVAVAATVVVTLLLVARGRERRAQAAALPAMWVAAYHDAVARGFGSANCCDGDCDLQTRCRQLFASALALEAGADVQLCGAYCGKPAGGAAAMLARSGSEPLCVFVLPRARAAGVPTGDFDGLRIHRRDFGALVVFEVSRLLDPQVLPHLYVPQG